ncbi:uncharacterized protein A1O9_00519 [Exophiala aquamarina CBS 119918]|uniref:Vps41 beta-propeller domain-containing protein n=1 Tax=Exophiala aquamarina CBS 119918 TaxID=1182545 RepID=A0A072PRP3_9EURO|nr:uncharacterized protein A1O9_00519 [Exophiala aquamarina CBS 119918]KEF62546.1 hypothetical protein A1O9_00519 [Exophiala aquamarina CBS 119918]
MAAGDGSDEPVEKGHSTPSHPPPPARLLPHSVRDDSEDEDEVEDGEDEEEEPKLKYANLTRNLSPLYRNGDATSAFLVAGDKMASLCASFLVKQGRLLTPLRVYHAHTASISAISISPLPVPLPGFRSEQTSRLAADAMSQRESSPSSSPAPKGKQQQLSSVPNTPSNQIYIATSSIDGNVCIASLVDPKDVQLRNFGRPVQTVALSPEYKSDRSYLSGGQAGSLILTTGGQAGKSANASTTGAVATASSWLGSIGLGANSGTDKALHSGEGIISTIKWSLSGKYVLWVNEQGIKIMRSNLKLESGESGSEWKRLSHIDRPTRPGWEDMAGVWKARVEWVDRENIEADDDSPISAVMSSSNGSASKPVPKKAKVEEVLVGWGDSAWIIHVTPAASDNEGGNRIGSAVVATIIRFDDCTISGISLYTPTLLVILAYMERKGNQARASSADRGKKTRRRHNALEPELRLIDIKTKEEIDNDTLTVSRYETLSASDYHLGFLPPVRMSAGAAQRGYLGTIGSGIGTVGTSLYTGVETVGQGVWDATMYGPRMLGANRMFSGADSIRSGMSGPDRGSARERNYLTGWIPGFGSSETNQKEDANSLATAQSMKIFIYSPYDCIVAIRRNLHDRVQWLTSVKKYQQAWELVDQHPEAAGVASEASEASTPPSPSKASSVSQSANTVPASPTQVRQQATLAEFFADSASMTSSAQVKSRGKFSIAEKEKRRIGELWLKQLVDAKVWSEAAEVAAKVLNTTTRWEHWIWVFVKSHRFDEISPHIPTLELTPPLPSSIFEIVLGHYLETDRFRFKELLDLWPSDLFDISSITTAIEDQLESGTAPKGSEDWRLLQEGIAKLFLADGHYNEALKCYIYLQDADTALSLIKDHHLVEAVADDIPSFVQLRVPSSQLGSISIDELDELAADPISVLADEATHGVVEPDEVIAQLDTPVLKPFLYFYLRTLWRGESEIDSSQRPRVGHSAAATALAADTGKQLAEQFADTAIDLFAEYDRALLMEFLQTSTAYTFEKAVKVCERKRYIEESVYLLSKTGQVKKALFLIIDELKDVSKAISFAKEQDDRGLWDDLLEYSMSRPSFISGLLEEVGTAIDPITLVKRIPSGLEVEGLKDGLHKMIREYDLQDSISSGVAKVLSSEVAVGMDTLRRGRRKGIKFDIGFIPQPKGPPGLDMESTQTPTEKPNHITEPEIQPGHCAACHRAFHQDESETLVGFACGHVYHVSHLLHGPDSEGDESTLPRSVKDVEEDVDISERFSRSVGPKVTNARLLKDKIQGVGGCDICKGKRQRAEVVGGV